MKIIKIADAYIKASKPCNIIKISDDLIKIIRDEILKKEFLDFSLESHTLFGENDQTKWLVGDGKMMSTSFYAFLMKYFFNVEAFSKEEIERFQIKIQDPAEREPDLYFSAHELIIFRGKEFLPLLRKLLKDLITEETHNSTILVSVMSAFWEVANKH